MKKIITQSIFSLLITANTLSQSSIWQKCSILPDPYNFFVNTVKSNSKGYIYAVGIQGGGGPSLLYYSTDQGINWKNSGDIAFAFDVAPNDNLFLGGPGSNLYRSLDDGSTWKLLTDFGFSERADKILATNFEGTVFVQKYQDGRTTTPGNVYRSIDNGDSWGAISYFYDPFYYIGIPLSAIYFCFDSTLIAVSSKTNYRSTDNGSSWNIMGGNVKGNVNLIATSKMSGYLYVISSQDIYRSTDNGVQWTAVDSGLTSTNAKTFVISGKGYCYVGTDSGLFVSKDWGTFWQRMSSDSLAVVSILLNDSNTVIINTNHGLFFSTDEGNSWHNINAGLPDGNISYLLITPNGYGFAISENNVYRTSLQISQITLVKNDKLNVPFSMELNQNYPNPFNPSTTIIYSIPQESRVLLKVYTMIGQEVLRLVDGLQSAGVHKITFEALHLSSGIYFYQLIANDNIVQTRKMVLLK